MVKNSWSEYMHNGMNDVFIEGDYIPFEQRVVTIIKWVKTDFLGLTA